MPKRLRDLKGDMIIRSRCSKLDIGDIVMVRQKGFTGKCKVVDRWEKDYLEVISQKPSGIPVFVVKSLGKMGGRTLHRNMLYPLSFQVQSESEQHDDVDYESLVGDQSENVDDSPGGSAYPTGANDSQLY